jgi:hypothetical protein
MTSKRPETRKKRIEAIVEEVAGWERPTAAGSVGRRSL